MDIKILNGLKNKFSDEFPFNELLKEVDSIVYNRIGNVYRVCTYGFNNDSFVTSYMEFNKFHDVKPKKFNENKLQNYSMSCFNTYDNLISHVNKIKKLKDKPIAVGVLCSNYGVMKINNKNGHIDFFLYDGMCPIDCFKEYKVS